MKSCPTGKPEPSSKAQGAGPGAEPGAIDWPPLIPGILIRRYKRFLADVELSPGQQVTAHCPNSGAMTACCEPGQPVYLSHHDNPRRKLAFTWEMIQMPTSLVGVNTQVPNRLVAAAAAAGRIPSLTGYHSVTREVPVGNRSRLDLRLEGRGVADCYVEIKNCTLVQNGLARFPDAKTTRGLRHLRELERLAAQGHRCVIFFLVQRMDARIFAPADDIDPDYGHGLRRAAGRGVEIQVYDVSMDRRTIAINQALPHRLTL